MKYLPNIAIAVIAIMGTVIIMSVFGKSGKSEKLIRAEMKVELIEEKRKYDSLMNSVVLKAKDELIQTLKQKDTVLITRYETTKSTINRIRPAVNSMGRDSIVAGIERYVPIN